jgi:hypothetical protein
MADLSAKLLVVWTECLKEISMVESMDYCLVVMKVEMKVEQMEALMVVNLVG